ncbi:MAG: cysteine desulfurase family protein [Bacteroidota bacterium]|nr:cysteine desulfurase family protein [Bacteroidota bacterium]
MRRIYLDYTATTPVDPQVFEEMKSYFMEKCGNPSSIHKYGQEAKAAIEESRDIIAGYIGAAPGELFFMSSGTESNNTAIKGLAPKLKALGKNHIITSKVEHHAVLESCEYLSEQGFDITYLDVDEFGVVNLEQLKNSITSRTGLISIMFANNEVGSINPVAQIGAIAKSRGILFHTDAVQAFGKIPVNINELNVDLLTITAHKLYGPKGIGALYVRKGVELEKLMHGGGQERGRRAGTESPALIVGFAKAAQIAHDLMQTESDKILKLKQRLKSKIENEFPFAIFNGHPIQSLPNILNVSFDSKKIKIDGEALILNMDLEGIAVTSGSACTSGSVKPSHVLLAMGRNVETAQATIRFSFGRFTTEEEVDFAFDVLKKTINRIGEMSNG